ncbi:hypothetical protein JTE90_029248 [Oedothorax gibbosus]|uniref:Uncharacterized protein n=1 Tax=Oedothorax gibbosus TaxID=931172 RepID=A0AAV6TVH6_9ARAC|nr:hypothetical protein JTE90_029248 [Oedothorax gibbosus]
MDLGRSLGRGRSRHSPNLTDDQKLAALTPVQQPRTVCLAGLLASVRFWGPQGQGEPSRALPASPRAPPPRSSDR